ncbi:3-methyladenine DNA glycosylase [Gordonia sp. HNM0687]|uniref:3-methyladenine DNA glycosylase n=1 Tax=Gordonia mangrovi TaxID=2665643 RepID=A0A6L7GZ28_9ACTN|nr:3-methyladenine DNA glycosylase [Gordonia mangrovi]MXP24065.1 3-methyladenine DNA glycosylase [Gordonia mangrovi]UVF78129.1 3-methyladenine DNA glycosylase [Gordonia mangrovi]
MSDPMTGAVTETRLSRGEWEWRRQRHRERVDALIGDYLRSRRRGSKHPVIDFLFTYYSSRPAHVRRWHPGYGVVLADADEFLSMRGYRRVDGGVSVDPAYLSSRTGALAATEALLRATASRPARLGCFGLHEWAMVYRTDDIRHDLPLRLGRAGTDAVVDQMPLHCTHFDAFRFFTPAARPHNEAELSRDRQLSDEQPGCLHATMDLYRACFTLAPLIDSALTLDSFALALRSRELDMRASPYDLRALGYPPVPIETPTGRAQYVREQSEIADAGAILRARVADRCRELLGQT